MNTSTKTFTFNPNKDKIEMIIKTARAYAIMARLLRSQYYLNLTKKTLSLLEGYINIDTKKAAQEAI